MNLELILKKTLKILVRQKPRCMHFLVVFSGQSVTQFRQNLANV
jgi:hypothetical protein